MTGPTSLNRKDLFTFITQYGFDDKINNDFIKLNQSVYYSFNVYKEVTSKSNYKTTLDSLLSKVLQIEQNKQPYYILYSPQKDGTVLILLVFIKDLNTFVPQSEQTLSLQELKDLIQNDSFSGTTANLDKSGATTFKIYKSVSTTQNGAQLSVYEAAQNPIKSYQFIRTISNGNIQMLLAVPQTLSPTIILTPTQTNEKTDQTSKIKQNIQSQINLIKSL